MARPGWRLDAHGGGSHLGAYRGDEYLQPITPVEHGMTEAAPPARPSASAAAAQTASETATPSPAAHTFEILLFTTIACSGAPAASRARPTVTGDPQKALRVKQAA